MKYIKSLELNEALNGFQKSVLLDAVIKQAKVNIKVINFFIA